MEQMTVNDVVKAAKGRLLCGDKNLPLLHISIDSRNVNEGDLFVPLIGEHSDAHAYLGQALSLGAAAVLTSEHDQMELCHVSRGKGWEKGRTLGTPECFRLHPACGFPVL